MDDILVHLQDILIILVLNVAMVHILIDVQIHIEIHMIIHIPQGIDHVIDVEIDLVTHIDEVDHVLIQDIVHDLVQDPDPDHVIMKIEEQDHNHAVDDIKMKINDLDLQLLKEKDLDPIIQIQKILII